VSRVVYWARLVLQCAEAYKREGFELHLWRSQGVIIQLASLLYTSDTERINWRGNILLRKSFLESLFQSLSLTCNCVRSMGDLEMLTVSFK
jgi:hypothetical protein